jgi:transcriptional regulator with XRE-family HTH domain
MGSRRLAQLLAAALTVDGRTQRALADALGVSAPTISQWLSGEREPGEGQLAKLAEELRLSTEQINSVRL